MIEARSLSFEINGQKLLSDINIQIAPGHITAIMGPNGAGKSTLLKCLAGSLTPSGGHVLIEQQPIASWNRRALARKRAVLSQANPIDFPFTIWDIASMGRAPYGSSLSEPEKLIVRSVLERMGLWTMRGRLIGSVSGGEQQKAHLARTILQIFEQDNSILMLDEPTSALDFSLQHFALEHVRALARAHNITVVAILHDLTLAKLYAEKIILLKSGKIFASGPVTSVLKAETIASLYGVEKALANAVLNAFSSAEL